MSVVLWTGGVNMAMKQANAAQKKWMKDIAEFTKEVGLGGLYGQEYADRYDFQLHHVLGRNAKHNKTSIGHEFIIPVPIELHDPNLKNEFHVGHCKKAFVKKFGTQSSIFQILISCMGQWGYTVPSMDIYNAIMDTGA